MSATRINSPKNKIQSDLQISKGYIMATKNKKRATTSPMKSNQMIEAQKTSVWDKAAFCSQ